MVMLDMMFMSTWCLLAYCNHSRACIRFEACGACEALARGGAHQVGFGVNVLGGKGLVQGWV